MVAYRIFKLGILVVFIFILLTGLTTSAQSQEETTKTTEMDQSSSSEENGNASQMHTIVLINNEFSPETAEINQYDTVVWRNLNKPKRTFVLESKNGLWEDFTLGYGKSFQYTFNETGTFGFNAEGESDLEGTVVVRESRETAEGAAPPSEEETQPQIQQEETEQQEEEVTSTPVEEVTPTQTGESIQSSENSVVIRGSVFYPDALELNKGETLVWKNLNKPKGSLMLVSEEELFENTILSYGKSFSYTFDEPGDYTFKLEEIPGTELTVTVE